MKRTYTQIYLISTGVLIWFLVILFAWQMQQNYLFYLWIINQPLLSDFGGASNQIILYGTGFMIGLMFVCGAALIKRKL